MNHPLKKYIKFMLLGLSALALGYLGYLWHMERSGYCFAEKRYLSDRELILHAMARFDSGFDFGRGDDAHERYLDKYPQCCSVTRTSYFWPFTGNLSWGLYEVDFGILAPFKHHPGKSDEYKMKYVFGSGWKRSTACAGFDSPSGQEPLDKIPSWFQSK